MAPKIRSVRKGTDGRGQEERGSQERVAKKKKCILTVEKTTVETAVERSVKLGNFSVEYSTRG